jgi:hypothetical protein
MKIPLTCGIIPAHRNKILQPLVRCGACEQCIQAFQIARRKFKGRAETMFAFQFPVGREVDAVGILLSEKYSADFYSAPGRTLVTLFSEGYEVPDQFHTVAECKRPSLDVPSNQIGGIFEQTNPREL